MLYYILYTNGYLPSINRPLIISELDQHSTSFDFDGIFFSSFFRVSATMVREIMTTTNSNKRQRTGQEDALLLSDLPDGILAHAASFLASPQKALFAVAMTSSESWEQNNIGSIGREYQQSTAAILKSDKWDVLDFEDIEKNLAMKLTDDDLHAVLKCINAQDVLKKLKLSGCINITGRGLQVLRGSTTIEHIDLSLVKQYESPELDPEPMISEEAVLPILDSIVSVNGSSLKMVIFPKTWCTAKTTKFTQLLTNYNHLLESREPKCLNCEIRLFEEREYALIESSGGNDYYGTQSYCCYKCTKNFCYHCDEEENGPLNCCGTCGKEYCVECAPVSLCDKCHKSRCNGCFSSGSETCQSCGEYFCSDCAPKSTAALCACADAGTIYCGGCFPEAFQCTKKGCNKVHCEYCELCDLL